MIGTFALVFAGAGAVMVDAKTGALGHVGVAITFGLVIMVMIYGSRAHLGRPLQPGRLLRVRTHAALPMDARRALLDRAAVGRTACRGTAARVARQRSRTSARRFPPARNAQSFVWEIVLTAFLMFVIMAVATDTRAVGEAAAIAIGGTVGLDAMFGGPISGASMNPARSAGPAIVSGDLHALWIYLVAPIAGAAVGAVAYQFVRGRPHERPVRVHRERRAQRDQRAAPRTRRRRPPSRAERRQQCPERQHTPRSSKRSRELGIDASDHVPQKLSQELIDWADVVVATCDDSCPYVPGKHYVNWQLPDPKGEPVERVREIRDDIAARVTRLVRELDDR